MLSFMKKKAGRITVRPLIQIALFLASLLVFIFISSKVIIGGLQQFDVIAFQQLEVITNPGLTKFMVFITFFGSHEFLLAAYTALIIYYLIKKNKKLSIYITFIGLSSTALLFLLKHLFQRTRPFDPLLHPASGFSYPSGHSFSGFCFFSIIIYVIWQTRMNKPIKWIFSVLLFLIAFTIAISRIYLHVHYASDILAGFSLSIILLTPAYWLFQPADKS